MSSEDPWSFPVIGRSLGWDASVRSAENGPEGLTESVDVRGPFAAPIPFVILGGSAAVARRSGTSIGPAPGRAGFRLRPGAGDVAAHWSASGSSSSPAGPSRRRSDRFTASSSTQVMSTMTTVAANTSGVLNEL